MTHDPKSIYYDAGGIELIDIIRAKLTPEQYQGFLLGNALKYLCRCNWKHDTIDRDIEKAMHYLRMLDSGMDATDRMIADDLRNLVDEPATK